MIDLIKSERAIVDFNFVQFIYRLTPKISRDKRLNDSENRNLADTECMIFLLKY